MKRAAFVALGGLGAAAGAGAIAYRRRQAAVAGDVHRNLTGAPVPMEQRLRAGAGVRGAARVAPPSWEPVLLRALADWEPAPPRGALAHVLVYAWAAPVTLVGLLVGAAAGVVPHIREGVLLFGGARGLTGAVLRRRGFDATALGHVIVARSTPSAALLAHELVHVRQAERFGPLFAPLYLGLLAVYGYARHPLERAARRAQRNADPLPSIAIRQAGTG